MSHPKNPLVRVAFQGEHGAFSEAAAFQLLGEGIITVPRATFESAFRAISENAADALLAPVENSSHRCELELADRRNPDKAQGTRNP